MKKYINKVNVLMEALPYIKQWAGKIIVIKLGGSAMIDEGMKNSIMEDIVLMKLIGLKPVIVHGGGPSINQMLKKVGITSSFHNGLRITDEETMEIVEMVLAGKINKKIVTDIQKHDLFAVGICGKDANTLIVKKKIGPDNVDLGYVGEITDVNPKLILGLLENDVIPVIAPIGKDLDGVSYNINADYAAAAIAGALQATKLVYLTDIKGVLIDINDENSLISVLVADEIRQKIDQGIIAGGMIPKVECSLTALKEGVKYIHI
ncbi:MAG: acetylglutamate kinase, partial [Candidatus Heimdallarchaeota archaeon]|nr:acetylglutamate kinase [Candidatus Heimdallarchaeota archaeon]